jgi:hypothetical protein
MNYIWYWITSVGYWLRPYDMLCDRRRWFWRERARCRSVVLLCRCELPSPTITYDANGYRRWCGTCGGQTS